MSKPRIKSKPKRAFPFAVIEQKTRSAVAKELVEQTAMIVDIEPDATAYFVVAWNKDGHATWSAAPGAWSTPFFTTMLIETLRTEGVSEEAAAIIRKRILET